MPVGDREHVRQRAADEPEAVGTDSLPEVSDVDRTVGERRPSQALTERQRVTLAALLTSQGAEPPAPRQERAAALDSRRARQRPRLRQELSDDLRPPKAALRLRSLGSVGDVQPGAGGEPLKPKNQTTKPSTASTALADQHLLERASSRRSRDPRISWSSTCLRSEPGEQRHERRDRQQHPDHHRRPGPPPTEPVPACELRADPEPAQRHADPQHEAAEEHDPDQQDALSEPATRRARRGRPAHRKPRPPERRLNASLKQVEAEAKTSAAARAA